MDMGKSSKKHGDRIYCFFGARQCNATKGHYTANACFIRSSSDVALLLLPPLCPLKSAPVNNIGIMMLLLLLLLLQRQVDGVQIEGNEADDSQPRQERMNGFPNFRLGRFFPIPPIVAILLKPSYRLGDHRIIIIRLINNRAQGSSSPFPTFQPSELPQSYQRRLKIGCLVRHEPP